MTAVKLEKILAGQVETSDSELEIKIANEKLPVGLHKFQLVVEDDSGNKSTPAQVSVIIVDSQAPTAVLELRDEQGKAVENNQIKFGSGFMLDGKRSSDIGGAIVKYVWEVVPQ